MTDSLRIALAQINPVVGDVPGNADKVRAARADAAAQGADLVVYGELVLAGYPPEDLVLKPAFQDACRAAAEALARETADGGPALLLTTPWVTEHQLYNAVLLADGGEIRAVRFKADLPNYGVFDEKRVFTPGPMPGPVNFRDVRLGVPICEDIWGEAVVECLEESGAEILLVPNGSPFEVDKPDVRLNHVIARVSESGLPMAYVNQVGGQDELAFDGASFVVNADRTLAVQMDSWRDQVVVTDWTRQADGGWRCAQGEIVAERDRSEQVYQAAMLALRDYVNKNGFPGVLIGLSGGIDSALSAAIAVDALGADRVHCVMMPSPYTSQESLDDAQGVVDALGMKYDTIAIGPAMAAFDQMLATAFAGTKPDTTEENIQARARGITLMALSNKFGHMVLSTGNKSEMSVGYATLYGDMCGGYNVLKDIYKTTVFAISRWRNQHKPATALGADGVVIPWNIITKPPSAELRPDQKDEDSLPPYDHLDDILFCFIENEMRVEEVVARGHDEATVKRIWRLLDIAEYKRRQAPPGVKISSRNFGRDRRYPITNAFRRVAAS
ncbi:MAG: NAD+ synthase [Alphaproteobacteria bacterium]|nr:NAD+ synthase [Alphaproteobacteria bacterium]MCB9929595.1 NAD+ synthase [Alphaproteobacteria bacterium]